MKKKMSVTTAAWHMGIGGGVSNNNNNIQMAAKTPKKTGKPITALFPERKQVT
jgi:hypothetical protein